MYCKNCGTQIKDDAKYCKECGTEIRIRANELKDDEIKFIEDKKIVKTVNQRKESNEQEYVYVFLNNLDYNKRELLRKALYYSNLVLTAVFVIMTIMHFKDEMDAAENYKLLVYVIRYINAIGFVAVLQFVIEQLHDCVKLKTTQLIDKNKSGLFILLEMLYIGLGVIAWILILNPTDGEMLSIFGAVATDGLFDYLMVIKVPVVLLIIAVFVKCYSDKYLRKSEKEAD